MRDHGFWLSMAIYGLYRRRADIGAPGEMTDEQVTECFMAHNDAVSAASMVLFYDREFGQPRDEEYAAHFEQVLQEAGHTEAECAEARKFRQDILVLAKESLDRSDYRRGDDPAACDPGGGMRSPDDRDDDGPR